MIAYKDFYNLSKYVIYSVNALWTLFKHYSYNLRFITLYGQIKENQWFMYILGNLFTYVISTQFFDSRTKCTNLKIIYINKASTCEIKFVKG